MIITFHCSRTRATELGTVQERPARTEHEISIHDFASESGIRYSIYMFIHSLPILLSSHPEPASQFSPSLSELIIIRKVRAE